jgi:CO/xanthine dehydrogenase FAD-binding subunit
MGTQFKPKQYHRPELIEAVSPLLKEGGAKIIAGGTDLLVNRPPGTQSLVDISRLGLDYVKSDEGGTAIGATICFTKIIASPILDKQPLSVLKDSAKEIGHHNLRHIATLGGNICNAVPSADSPVALIALDSIAVIEGPDGERTVPLVEFITFVRETVLKRGEFLKEIRIPIQPEKTAASFQKLGRTKVDIALVNVACRITVADGLIKDSRIVLGAVSPTPIRAKEAESILNGKALSDELLGDAAKAAASAAKPISDHRASAGYRREMSQVLVERAILDAYGKAEEMA